MPQEYVFSLFSDRQNVLSRIHNWKDKFENFQLKLGGTLDGKRFDFAFCDAFVGQCWTQDAYSEAMWGIYANDISKRFLRIRSTPRKLLGALAAAHPTMPQHINSLMGKRNNQVKGHLGLFVEFELHPRSGYSPDRLSTVLVIPLIPYDILKLAPDDTPNNAWTHGCKRKQPRCEFDDGCSVGCFGFDQHFPSAFNIHNGGLTALLGQRL